MSLSVINVWTCDRCGVKTQDEAEVRSQWSMDVFHEFDLCPSCAKAVVEWLRTPPPDPKKGGMADPVAPEYRKVGDRFIVSGTPTADRTKWCPLYKDSEVDRLAPGQYVRIATPTSRTIDDSLVYIRTETESSEAVEGWVRLDRLRRAEEP